MFKDYTYSLEIGGDWQSVGSDAEACHRLVSTLCDMAVRYTLLVADVRWVGSSVQIDLTERGFRAAHTFFSQRSHEADQDTRTRLWIESATGHPAKPRIRAVLAWARESRDIVTIDYESTDAYRFGVTDRGLEMLFAYLSECEAEHEAGQPDMIGVAA